MSEKKRNGRSIPCWTCIAGKIEKHETIKDAGERLGVTAVQGSMIRQKLRETGFYKPRGGIGFAWLDEDSLPKDEWALVKALE